MDEAANTPGAGGKEAGDQEPIIIQSADGEPMPVTPVGSLGLLAIGYKGIMLWREARHRSGWKPIIKSDGPDAKAAKSPAADAKEPHAAPPELDPDKM